MSSIPQSSVESTIQIRTLGKRWFWIDNAIYDRYAHHLGLAGLGLYVALARYANNKTAQCWPSLTRLATEMGTEVEILEDALDCLVAVGLLAVSRQPGKGTVLTLLAPPVSPPIVSRACEDVQEQNLEQEKKKSLVEVCSPERNKPEEQTSSLPGGLRKNPPTPTGDETSSWSKPPVAWTAARPDTVLSTALLTAEEYATWYRAAEQALMTEGVKAFCLTRPVIEARMTVLLDQRVHVERTGEGCLHEHVHDAGHCNDCGEVLAGVA